MLRSVVIARMLSGLDGKLFRGQPEGIPTHRVQDVEAAHPLEAGDDVGGRVSFDVAHVQTLAARIRKHVEDVELRLCWIKSGVPRIRRTKHSVGQPSGLPFGFEIEKGKLLALGCHSRADTGHDGFAAKSRSRMVDASSQAGSRRRPKGTARIPLTIQKGRLTA